jgi:hypothetical protein
MHRRPAYSHGMKHKGLTRHISLQQFMQGNDGEVVAQQQPGSLRLDGRNATAILDQFSWLRRRQQQFQHPAKMYVVQEHPQNVLFVPARRHDVLPVDFTWE